MISYLDKGYMARSKGLKCPDNNDQAPTRSGMLQVEVLVLELSAINRLAAGAVSSGEVTSLGEKVDKNIADSSSWVFPTRL